MIRSCAVILIILLKFAIPHKRGSLSHKIVGGFTCHPSDYPYLISLKTATRRFYCGGSLLNRFHVLTAGHCCDYENNHEQIQIIAGVSRKRSTIQTSRVWKRFIHPHLDVCVLRLYWPIEQTSCTQFVKLATEDMLNELMKTNSCDKSITMGFGYQGVVEALDGTPRPIIQKPELQCVQQKVLRSCPQQKYVLCVVGANKPGEDACFGDSGGPLICNGIQIGFVSSGIGCALGIPSYYINVASVYDYIKTTSANNILGIRKLELVAFMLLYLHLLRINAQ